MISVFVRAFGLPFTMQERPGRVKDIPQTLAGLSEQTELVRAVDISETNICPPVNR